MLGSFRVWLYCCGSYNVNTHLPIPSPDHFLILIIRWILVCPKWVMSYNMISYHLSIFYRYFLLYHWLLCMIFIAFSFLFFFWGGVSMWVIYLKFLRARPWACLVSLPVTQVTYIYGLPCSSCALFFLYILLFYVLLTFIPFCSHRSFSFFETYLSQANGTC